MLAYLVLFLMPLVGVLALVAHEYPSAHMHERHSIILNRNATLACVRPVVDAALLNVWHIFFWRQKIVRELLLI